MDALSSSLPLALKIMLGSIAFVTGFVAIGGETYTPGPGPFLRRLTTRGRVAIACAILTFILGALDQLVSEAGSSKKETALDDANKQIMKLLEKQGDEVGGLKEEARIAKEQVEDVRKDLRGAAKNITVLNDRLVDSGKLIEILNRSLKSPAQKEDIQELKKQLSRPMSIAPEQLKPMADDLGDLKSALGEAGAIRSDLRHIKTSSLDSATLSAAFVPVMTAVGALKADLGTVQTELPKLGAAIGGLTSRAVGSIEGESCQKYFDAVAARTASGDDAQKTSFQRILISNQKLWAEASAIPEQKVWVSAACASALAAL
ncbi:hypothetical protein WME99_36580 [Sorangium sp. So ce136]|uniref:hypothetical protein n=1 Tax=Sorangium sp. So ce136 TaxID=3133284 RepID=UPI003F1128E7